MNLNAQALPRPHPHPHPRNIVKVNAAVVAQYGSFNSWLRHLTTAW